jgi:hypothetical protein
MLAGSGTLTVIGQIDVPKGLVAEGIIASAVV